MAEQQGTSPAFAGLGKRNGQVKTVRTVTITTWAATFWLVGASLFGFYLGKSEPAADAAILRPCDKFPPPCQPVTSSTVIEPGKAPSQP